MAKRFSRNFLCHIFESIQGDNAIPIESSVSPLSNPIFSELVESHSLPDLIFNMLATLHLPSSLNKWAKGLNGNCEINYMFIMPS